MKKTKKKFEFESQWNGWFQLSHEGNGSVNVSGARNSNAIANDPKVCEIGAKLHKWLGKRKKKVKITITKL